MKWSPNWSTHLSASLSLSAAVRTQSGGCEERHGSSCLSPSCISLHHPWPFELPPTPVLVSWLITDLPVLCISFILWKGSWWYVYPRLYMSCICSFLSWTDSLRFTSSVTSPKPSPTTQQIHPPIHHPSIHHPSTYSTKTYWAPTMNQVLFWVSIWRVNSEPNSQTPCFMELRINQGKMDHK